MQVKNINELRMDFPVTYLDKTYIIKYDQIVELPDGAVPMEGIKGWLVCRPTPVNRPNLIEIDLNDLPIYDAERYELTEEEEEKAKKVLELSLMELLERKEQSKEIGESKDENTRTETESKNNSGNNRTEASTGTIEEPTNTSCSEDNQEDPKFIQEKRPLEGKRIKKGIGSRIEEKTPLKGFKIKRSVKKERKDKNIQRIIDEGKRDYIEEARSKVDEKLGI